MHILGHILAISFPSYSCRHSIRVNDLEMYLPLKEAASAQHYG